MIRIDKIRSRWYIHVPGLIHKQILSRPFCAAYCQVRRAWNNSRVS